MPLRRRNDPTMAIWPGFVDAMTAMLLVFTFVLSIFMITQYFLRDTILGQEEALNETESALDLASLELQQKDSAVSDLTVQLDTLSDVLALERKERGTEREQAQAEALRLSASLSDLRILQENTQARLAEISTARDAEAEEAARLAAEREAFEQLTISLRQDLTDTEAERAALLEQVDAVTSELTAEERRRAVEAAAAEALRARLSESDAAFTALELELDQQRAKAEETLTLIAAARLAEERLQTDLSARDAQIFAQANELAETEQALAEREALLATAKTELSAASASAAEEQRQIVLLNEQTRALRQQLSVLAARLEVTEGERDTLESSVEARAVEVRELGSRLNTALTERNSALEEKEKVLEERNTALDERNAALEEVKTILEERVDTLEEFRSEFFGRVKAAIANRDDIAIVGDRFVFQSEVLFAAASADLNAAGEAELSKFAEVLRGLASDIPGDLNWILRIDGHTDNRPLAAGRSRYRNNWELSQARALSVAEYLIDFEGIAPERLAPTGFGEFQPVTESQTPEGYALNRRIELKLTER